MKFTTKNTIIFSLLILVVFGLQAQKYTFGIELEAMEIDELGGLQSYSFGQSNGVWLIVGGRLDGLHRRQPFASFDAEGKNDQLIVVDPVNQEIWKASLEGLQPEISEQLHSTNMEFYQEGDNLILIGGYAYSPSQDEHITFPSMLIMDVPKIIDAIKNDESISEFIYRIEDEKMAVTGGHLEKINDVFYLVGGQKFTGRYNPMGPDHGPGFIQEYTDEIRKFELLKDGSTYTINHIETLHDEIHLHRRDYNLGPTIKDGKQELMIFSGVFKPTVDLPYLYPVSITDTDYSPHEEFQQFYNHYHSANLGVYDEINDEMHTIFFGGIAQFYKENGMKIQDNDVPFVKTIASVSRLKDGSLLESILDSEMPDYLGASAEFIPIEEVEVFENGVIKLDYLSTEKKLVGYIYGGINSSEKNIFWINDGSQSIADNTIYKVYMTKKSIVNTVTSDEPEMEVRIFPNPAGREFRLILDIEKLDNYDLKIYYGNGQLVSEKTITKNQLQVGRNIITVEMDSDLVYGEYIVKVESTTDQIFRKLIYSE